jgi:hypothetical protein
MHTRSVFVYFYISTYLDSVSNHLLPSTILFPIKNIETEIEEGLFYLFPRVFFSSLHTRETTERVEERRQQ